MVAAVYHHKPLNARNFPLDAAIIHVADSRVHKANIGNSGEPACPEIKTNIHEKFGLEENLFKKLEGAVKEKLVEVMQMFSGYHSFSPS